MKRQCPHLAVVVGTSDPKLLLLTPGWSNSNKQHGALIFCFRVNCNDHFDLYAKSTHYLVFSVSYEKKKHLQILTLYC